MSHPYVISLDNDKYRVINDNGLLTFLRYGEPWFPAEEMGGAKVVLAMAQRIEELEAAIRAVLDGPTVDDSRRDQTWALQACWKHIMGATSLQACRWYGILSRALEQK
jgi:hypothetical protein